MKRNITWLIVLMTFSLVGIIVIQVIWMRNAWKVKNELFERGVNEAMIGAAHRLETLSDVMLLNRVITPPPAIQTGGPARLGFPPIKVHDRKLPLKPQLRIKQHEINYTQHVGSDQRPSDSIITRIEVIEFDSVIHDMGERIGRNMIMVFSDSVPEILDTSMQFQWQFNQKVDRLKNMAGKMAFESWRFNHPPKPDTILIKNLLMEELAGRDIALVFEFGLGNEKTIQYRSFGADSLQLAHSLYKTLLFPNSVYASENYCYLYFPGQKNFVFRSLIGPALLSVLFCTVILATFILSLQLIVRQKKISEMKSDFINNMTHEFKTPLATISLAADTIVNPKIINHPEQIVQFTEIIKKENTRMNHQVETILQIASLDKKDFEFRFQVADLHDLIRKAVLGIQLQIESRSGQVDLSLEAENPKATVDPQHFSNVINNLLDNALKYSPQSPEIAIATRNTANGIRISVSDKGQGMSKQVQSRIFEKFYRETRGDVHNVKGFGLGLSYVRAVIEANRGEIKVESEPGRGSRFDLFVPFVLNV